VPDRYLREALLSSERWNSCSLDAQNLYMRLLLLADDYGVFDGREGIIAQKGYMFRRDDALPLEELHRAGLIVRYTNAGRPYLALTQWGEGLRGRRRFPAPPVNVDQPDIKYRGKYGQPMKWENPQGTEAVSILIDLTGRAATPQPPEWRRVDSDWMPNGSTPYVPPQSRQAMTTSDGTPLRQAETVVTARHDGVQEEALATAGHYGGPHALTSLSLSEQSPSQPSSSGNTTSHGTPSLSPSAPPTTPMNGKIERQGGTWRGVSDAQVRKWQEMFADVSVTDQIDRAGAWYDAHPEEAAQIAKDGGEHAFIVRWLLREVRPRTGTTKAKTDA
jgi:hypothetical protein